MEMNTPGGVDQTSKAVLLMGFGLILTIFILLISLGLGIAGFIQKKRKRIFSVLGFILSFLISFPFLILVLSQL